MHTSTQSDRGTVTKALAGILVGGVAFLVGGGLHPRAAEGIEETDLAVASMAADGAWYPAHVLSMIGFVIIGVSIAALVRHAWPEDSAIRRFGWVLVAGAGLGALDSIPHIFLKTELDELVAGGSTPLTDTHMVTQFFATPVFGAGVVLVALYGARERLFGHWFPAALGIIGGTAWAFAGPGVALGGEDVGALFAGGFGVAWFLIISGVIGMVRRRRAVAPSPALAA